MFQFVWSLLFTYIIGVLEIASQYAVQFNTTSN